jgi:lysophospholipase L1-like esterase
MKLVCIGDSLTYGYRIKREQSWTNVLKDKIGIEVINKGISGDTSNGMLSRLYNDVILNRPDEAVIMGGINDLLWGLDIKQITSNLASMAFQLMQNCVKPVFGLSIPVCTGWARKKWGFMSDFININENLKKLNDGIIKFSRGYNIGIIDFYSNFIDVNGEGQRRYYIDGVHLNAAGNLKMTDIILFSLV